MTFAKDLLQKILDQAVSHDERALLRCQLAKQLEDAGNYEAARDAMAELWHGVGEPPVLEGLQPLTAANVLIRVGALTGWIGSTRQIEDAQETAKNLISQGISIFELGQDAKRVAEGQIELAVCYWREGAFDEARVMLAEALSQLDDQDGDLKAVALFRSAAIEKVANRLNDALHVLGIAAPLFEVSTNHTLKGRYHNELGTVLKNLGATERRKDYVDRALIEYAAASFHFEEAGHARYQACVENNLAMLFLRANKLSEAHEHLDRAQALFTKLRDSVHLAQVDETRARVLLAQGRVADAQKLARAAVRTLEKGDEQSLLAEALTTLGIVRARQRDHEEARSILERAMNVADQAGDPETAGRTALTLVEEFGRNLSNDDLCAAVERAAKLLENTHDLATARRLADAACRALAIVHAFPVSPEWTDFSFRDAVLRYEAHLIRQALKDSGGRPTRAAHLLGFKHHQSLLALLSRRHKNLRYLAVPSMRRRRSVISERGSDHSSDCVRKHSRTIKILHVEDNQVVAEAVKETLEVEGWEVHTCADGAAALKKILSNDHYDLLLLDDDLPGVSGMELVRRARATVHREDIPIIVLSAALGEAEARKAGADMFLHKPEDIRTLVRTISGLVRSD